MNPDELKNLVPLLVTLLAPLGAKYGFSAGDLTSALTGVAGIAIGVWLHWNMKKVPETSLTVNKTTGKVVPFLIPAALVAGLGFGHAHAASLITKAPAYSIPSVPCAPTACTGFYGGGFIAGNGTNADILGNGVAGSVFAGGIDPGLDVGWQYASGDYLLGIEGMFGYEFASLVQVNNVGGNVNGMFGIIQAKAGLALSSLFGSQPALNISLPLPVIAPYVAVGEMIQQKGGTGNVSGAGIEFATPADNLFLDVEYLYGGGTATNTGLTTSTSNMIFMKVNRTF